MTEIEIRDLDGVGVLRPDDDLAVQRADKKGAKVTPEELAAYVASVDGVGLTPEQVAALASAVDSGDQLPEQAHPDQVWLLTAKDGQRNPGFYVRQVRRVDQAQGQHVRRHA